MAEHKHPKSVGIRKLSSRVVYRNSWMTVREDEVERAGGVRGLYGVVEKYTSAIVIPFDGEQLCLIEQYRYPVGQHSLEFPQGSLERNDVAPVEIARQELRQEAGLEAGSLQYLGEIFIAIGYSDQKTHAYVARHLTRVQSEPEAEEQDLVLRRVRVQEFEQLVRDNVIKDAQTMAAWTLYKSHTPR
jgi:ADP-ribose pyrophosphatase